MKSAIVASILLAGALSTLAQGVIIFNNHISGQVSAPFYGPETGGMEWYGKYGNTATGYPAGTQVYTGALLSGPDWRAQLLAAPGTQAASALAPVGPSTTFRIGPAAGFIAPVTVTLDGIPADGVATFQVAIWDNSSQLYPTWDQARAVWQMGALYAGLSPLYYAPATGSTTFLQSFNAYYVDPIPTPEPSTMALLSLGGLWLVACRRRK